MKPYDIDSCEKHLAKASALQSLRSTLKPQLHVREIDDSKVLNPDPISLEDNLVATISHGQGVRYAQEDEADVFVIDDPKKLIAEDPAKYLWNSILDMQAAIQVEFSRHRFHCPGSTFNVSLQFGGKIYTANVGDSRAILLQRREGEQFEPTALNWDHKPDDEDERQRIERNGGYVGFENRLNDMLALSRALGDCEFDGRGISHEPDITIVDVDPEKEMIILNCCDGVVDVMTEKDIALFFDENGLTNNPANALRQEAFLRGSMDNITVCVTPVIHDFDKAVISYVADGHGGEDVSGFIYQYMKRLFHDSD